MKSILLSASLLVSICAAVAQTNVIFPRQGTVWKYNQTNDLFTDAPLTWMTFDYDDSGPSWQQGPALLSNDSGSGVINPLIQTTILSPRSPTSPTPGNGPEPPQHARFFRKKFTYADPVAPFTQLRMNHRFDDGVIIWLNGVEIGRKYFNTAVAPTFTLRSDCFPCQTGPCTGGGDPDCADEISLFPGDQLLQGDNIIAFSLHQTGNDSSDITFGTSLEVILPRTPTILSNSEPADRIVLQNRSTTLRVFAEASPAPTYQWYYSSSGSPGSFNPLTDQTNSSYTIPSMQSADQGYYYCTVANPIGSVDSRTAFVQYTEDGTAPLALGALAPDFVSIHVQFNEAMDALTTGDLFSWGVTDGVNAYEINAITLSADGTIATLSLSPGFTLPENTVFTVSITAGPADLAGNVIVDTNHTFRSFVSGCSGFLFETYGPLSTTDNNINNTLKVHPSYPEDPREPALRMPSFDTRHAYPDNTHEGFGARVRGLFAPSVSGPWTFYVASDDWGQLYVNPNGPDAAGRQLVAEETGCCNDFQVVGPRTSVPLNLQAGQAYYVEANFKEGTGGDWLKVVARRSSEPAPLGSGNTDNAQVIPIVIQGGPGPAGILSHVVIGTQPANRTVRAGDVVSFSVRLTPDVPGCFQWKRDGVDIPAAVGPNHKFTASLADNGAKFSVVVSLMGGTTLTSSEATLTVEIDDRPPVVTNVAQNVAGDVTVTFNEPISMNAATNPANWLIDGVAPTAATASGSSSVILAPATALAVCPAGHTISVGNVQDVNGNTISPNPTLVAATLNDLLVLPINAAVSWRFDESGNELGSDWYAKVFDDSLWSNGAPAFGVETATVLPVGFPIRTAHNWSPVKLSLYYRAHFNMPSDPSSVTALQLHHYIDDGAVFYLNGQELTRVRMPGGPVDTNTVAVNYTETTPGVMTVMNVPAGALVFGDNVLAARVNQSGATSSDTVFQAGLVAQVTACTAERPLLDIERSGNTVTISLRSGPNGTIYRASSLSGPWSVVGPAPQTVNIGPGMEIFEIRP
jgi:hypothetical protein